MIQTQCKNVIGSQGLRGLTGRWRQLHIGDGSLAIIYNPDHMTRSEYQAFEWEMFLYYKHTAYYDHMRQIGAIQ